MEDSILRTKSRQYALDIIKACREMRKSRVEYALIDQLMRSGTSVGANVHEAQYAHGKKDFVSKLEIALKECNESSYWLDLLLSTQSIDPRTCKKLLAECDEIRRLLISSILTVKSKLNN